MHVELWGWCIQHIDNIFDENFDFRAVAAMETIEKNVSLLLNGQDAEESQEFCDFTLEDQNEAAGLYLLLSTSSFNQ